MDNSANSTWHGDGSIPNDCGVNTDWSVIGVTLVSDAIGVTLDGGVSIIISCSLVSETAKLSTKLLHLKKISKG